MRHRIGVISPVDPRETRVPLIPEQVIHLVQMGAEVLVPERIAASIHIPDEAYQQAGATVLSNSAEILTRSDILLSIRPPDVAWVKALTPGTIWIGMLDPFNKPDLIEAFARQGVTAIAMELIPRATRAQKMDVLSSQAGLAGYVSVILAAERLPQVFPMMITPAGTLKPARVFVIGAGVAGLQAIATAKRLGARVEAFDTRPVVKEEVQSLGAKFVELDLGETGQTKEGYARALTEDQLKKQRETLAKVCAHSDVVITTAQVFGRKAPTIITEPMIRAMQPGSVIIDLAVESGGNVEISRPGEEIDYHGVRIVGFENLAGRVPKHASQMLSANFTHFLAEFWDSEKKIFDLSREDEILHDTLVTREGKIVNEKLLTKPA